MGRTVLRWKTRRIRKNQRITLPALESILAQLKKRHHDAKAAELEHFERFYNVALFIVVLDYDVAVLTGYFASAYREWEKKFAARQLAILLHEASDDLPKLLDGEFRNSLKAIPLPDSDLNEVREVLRILHSFKKRNRAVLSELRHYVGAHRDHDAGKQLEIIEQINPMAIYQLAGDFYVGIHRLTPLLIKVTTMLSHPGIMITHCLKAVENSRTTKSKDTQPNLLKN